MKELRNRLKKSYNRHQKLFDDAMRPLSPEETNDFLDRFYELPGLTEYISRKVDEYEAISGEPMNKYIDRHFLLYKGEYERKVKNEHKPKN